MVNLDATIALASMSCVLGSYYYKIHPPNENIFNNFFNAKWKWIEYVIKAYLFHDLYLMYVVEAFIALDWKN